MWRSKLMRAAGVKPAMARMSNRMMKRVEASHQLPVDCPTWGRSSSGGSGGLSGFGGDLGGALLGCPAPLCSASASADCAAASPGSSLCPAKSPCSPASACAAWYRGLLCPALECRSSSWGWPCCPACHGGAPSLLNTALHCESCLQASPTPTPRMTAERVMR